MNALVGGWMVGCMVKGTEKELDEWINAWNE